MPASSDDVAPTVSVRVANLHEIAPPVFHAVDVEGSGMTINFPNVGSASAVVLLEEDPLRIAAYIYADNTCFIGSKNQMLSGAATGGFNSATGNGPGCRIGASLSPVTIHCINEVWIGIPASAPTNVSVWVERKVQGKL